MLKFELKTQQNNGDTFLNHISHTLKRVIDA